MRPSRPSIQKRKAFQETNRDSFTKVDSLRMAVPFRITTFRKSLCFTLFSDYVEVCLNKLTKLGVFQMRKLKGKNKLGRGSNKK